MCFEYLYNHKYGIKRNRYNLNNLYNLGYNNILEKKWRKNLLFYSNEFKNNEYFKNLLHKYKNI